jgi:hypothetical protein
MSGGPARHSSPTGLAYFRARQWAQDEECHDEIARSIARPGHVIDYRLNPMQKAYVRAGADAVVGSPRLVLRFRLLEAALDRVSAESPDDTLRRPH